MIKQKTITINGRELTETYSDDGFKIRKIGTDEIYDKAIDIPNRYEYEETTELVEVYEDEELTE
jgi:hypothetical protein